MNNDRQALIGFIEILNDLTYNIVSITDGYYAFTEFIEVQDGVNEITVIGRDITTLVNNSVSNVSLSGTAQNALVTQIDQIPLRRRVFSPNTPYIKYTNYRL